MAWSASAIFRQFVADTLAGTSVFDLDAPSDTYKVALYGTTPTPDKDVAANASAYNSGQWVTGNEISASGWAAGGIAATSMTVTVPSTGVIMFDLADTVSTTTTLAGVFGTLLYNDTKTTPVADQGVCFNYLGGTNSVTAGIFTVVWNANGAFRITV